MRWEKTYVNEYDPVEEHPFTMQEKQDRIIEVVPASRGESIHCSVDRLASGTGLCLGMALR